MFDVFKHWPARAANHVIALIINADEIEFSAVVSKRDVFLPQQLHAMAIEQGLGRVFRAGINLVISVASPGTQRGAQSAQLGNAIFQGIVLAADEITGYNSEVGCELIG